MATKSTHRMELGDFSLWDKYKTKGKLHSINFEITARCNLNCRHCYINLPVSDLDAAAAELSLDEMSDIADQAVAKGAMWCLLTGGEPLLRKDFDDIYMMLKRKGLLMSVFTNATLVQEHHLELFKKYPPRDMEVTVYGASRETFERVTRKEGSFDRFTRKLFQLQKAGVNVRLKAMALRSNVHEMDKIAEFCHEYTKDFFRYDPNLHYRFDGDAARNEEIKEERLSPEEIVRLEQNDDERSQALQNHCNALMLNRESSCISNTVFKCGVGSGNSVTIGANGYLRLCSDLFHPAYMADLRKESLQEAMQRLLGKVNNLTSDRVKYMSSCARCSIVNFCQWCPADAYLETGRLDEPINYYCNVAHARVKAVEQVKDGATSLSGITKDH
jgi:radical SAM protein with 4Fe4S-binding SPASM domain